MNSEHHTLQPLRAATESLISVIHSPLDSLASIDIRRSLGSESIAPRSASSILRTWIRSTKFNSVDEKLEFVASSFDQIRPFMNADEHSELIISHLVACIDTDTVFVGKYLVPALARFSISIRNCLYLTKRCIDHVISLMSGR
jgi:hypothetical protein